MARPRRKINKKSNVRNIKTSQLKGTTRKRKSNEAKDSQQAHNKRRRTRWYNLRHSSSLVLVSETPCCQSPEQQEKYARLGLNTALFLNSSQCPRRKQSHISVITISSDDEETSEERTSEWVNNLAGSQQCDREPELDHFSISSEREQPEDLSRDTVNVTSTTEELSGQISLNSQSLHSPARSEQTFHPLCASTPCNIVPPPIQHQSVELRTSEDSDSLTSTEPPMGYNTAVGLDNFGGPSNLCTSIVSDCLENLNPDEVRAEKVPHFYFGSAAISTNGIPTFPTNYFFNNNMHTSFGGFTPSSTQNVDTEINQRQTPETRSSKNTNMETELDSQNNPMDETFSKRDT